ncbi:MAG TPA: hypothetical protein VGN42_09135, partial [Pirellulales bacterium]|nr:hypothetical protein [Pirellulales bacterium]
VSEFEVRDGAALMLWLSFWEKRQQTGKQIDRGADRQASARPAEKPKPAAEPHETIAELAESKRAATGFSSSEARMAARKAREVLDGPEGLYERERALARMDARDPSFAAGVRETAELFQTSTEDVINGAIALAVMGFCGEDAADGKRAAPSPGPAVKPVWPSYAQLREQRRRTVPARVQVQRSIAAAQTQAAQAQAAANAARQQQPNNNSGPDPYVLGMLLYPQGAYPGPVSYGGPFNETISRYGNQTYINGSGSPYPFAPYGGLGGGY